MNERLKELAMQAGLDAKEIREDGSQTLYAFEDFDIERFADLMRQDERAERGAILRKQDEQIKEMQLTNARLFEKFNKAVLAEREACAALCESMGVHPALNVWNGGPDWYKRQKECAAAIRARSEHSPSFKNYMGDNWAGIV
jgi:hypothetical protein